MRTTRALKAATALAAALMLAGCAQAPSEQERTMTPTESEQALIELIASTMKVMPLSDTAWDWGVENQTELLAGPCRLSNGELGANYIDDRTWTGDTDVDALVGTVQESWESLGLTTTIDVRGTGKPRSEQHIFLTGWGGPVKNIGITVIPGQVTLSGESICVVGDSGDLNRHLG